MDNRLFNVNGSGDELLLAALSLVFKQQGDNTKCKAWVQTKDHGLILLWYKCSNSNELPTSLTAEDSLPIVKNWLKGDFAKDVVLSDWCNDSDHDGHNSNGWQVYCEDWGHVGGRSNAICAIKPAFMWNGK